MDCELQSMKGLKLLYFTSMEEFSGRNVTIEVLSVCHVSYHVLDEELFHLLKQMCSFLQNSLGRRLS
jgi:hypothetical protein